MGTSGEILCLSIDAVYAAKEKAKERACAKGKIEQEKLDLLRDAVNALQRMAQKVNLGVLVPVILVYERGSIPKPRSDQEDVLPLWFCFFAAYRRSIFDYMDGDKIISSQ